MSNDELPILLAHSRHDAPTLEVIGEVRQSVDCAHLDTMDARLAKFTGGVNHLNDLPVSAVDRHWTDEVTLP